MTTNSALRLYNPLKPLNHTAEVALQTWEGEGGFCPSFRIIAPLKILKSSLKTLGPKAAWRKTCSSPFVDRHFELERNSRMLHKLKDLAGYKLLALDGEIGKVKEFYFDDSHWTVRYLVADTGNWLTGRTVLISPYALDEVIESSHDLAVNLTKRQIENSPSLESDKPVSQQFELSYYGYYGWPSYWGSSYMWGSYPYIVRDPAIWKNHHSDQRAWDPHLRSSHQVTGHHIEATDGEIGHVDDFIIDDETWAIRYLVVDTRNWWPGKKVLISPKWIEKVSWSDSKVYINLSREQIRNSPEYHEQSQFGRNFESELHRHYHQVGYWTTEQAAKGKQLNP